MAEKSTATVTMSLTQDASPRLNTALHLRLLLEGGAVPSTLASAKEALERIRSRRNQKPAPDPL